MNGYLAEVRKLWTVRTTWVLTLLGWGLVALSSSVTVFGTLVGPPFDGSDAQVGNAVDQVGGSAMIVLIVALLAMTTEFRHGTIGRTLQVEPSRTRMLLAKLAVGATYALAYFATSLLVVGAVLAIAAVVQGVPLSAGSATLTALWQGPVGLVLNAVLGVALGALIRSQVVAIALTLVWLFLVESLVAALLPDVARWLPFQALNALFTSPEAAAAAPGGAAAFLDPAAGLAVFLGYVLAAAAGAVVLLRTRDV
jgi:ABC-2 type transport system permease protein